MPASDALRRWFRVGPLATHLIQTHDTPAPGMAARPVEPGGERHLPMASARSRRAMTRTDHSRVAGTSSIGLYFPRSRLDRALIAKAWGNRPTKGERAVASYDEDALTMAVEAAHRCLEEIDSLSIDGLFFASTSSPYREKQVASVVATACDLPREILTADFGGSVRAGVTALGAAVRAVQSGAARRVLVVASDSRPTEPESELEAAFGDGAVAVVVDRDARIAEFADAAAVAEEFTFQWRRDEGAGVQVQ